LTIHKMMPGQTVCTQKDEKGKSCFGSLKYYYPFDVDYGETDATLRSQIAVQLGKDHWLKLHKCYSCQALYQK
jgi:hypothetical protein